MILSEILLAYSVKQHIRLISSMDRSISKILAYKSFEHKHLSSIAVFVQGADLFKIIPLLSICVWCWFSSEEPHQRRESQQRIFIGMIAACISVITVMALQKVVGYRPRPIYLPEFSFFASTTGFKPENDVSSFPSDTSALAIALSTVTFLHSKRVGIAAYAWSLVVVIMPRMFVGLHYFSDVLAASLNGAACIIAAQIVANYITWPSEQWLCRARPIAYAFSFIVLVEVSQMGGNLRPLLNSALRTILNSLLAK